MAPSCSLLTILHTWSQREGVRMPIIFTVCCAGYSGEAECCWLPWQKLTAPRTWDPCKSTQQSVFFSRAVGVPVAMNQVMEHDAVNVLVCLSTNKGDVCLHLHLSTPADRGMSLIQQCHQIKAENLAQLTPDIKNTHYPSYLYGAILSIYCFGWALNIMELDDARLVELKVLKECVFKKQLNKNRT